MERASAAGVLRMVTIATNREDWEVNRHIAALSNGRVSYTVGLHPSDVTDGWEDQTDALRPWFSAQPAPVGVGEVGLDYFRLPSDRAAAETIVNRQQAAFRRQLDIAAGQNCPVVVHSRSAFNDCVELVDASPVDWNRVVFHCFTEGPDEIEVINRRGGRGSFTGIITYPSATAMREAALRQGLGSVMIETDSPYLAPVPERGKRNEPALIRYTAETCAEIFGLDVKAFVARATENTVAFFDLP